MLATRTRGPAETFALLNCRRLPARLNTTETAVLLGFQEHDIPVLIAAKLLTPLGKPVSNAPKYFAAVDISALCESTDWLSKATKAIATHWHRKNKKPLVAQPSIDHEDNHTRTTHRTPAL